jgi:hypothetical protein
VQNERDAGTAGGFAVQRRGVEPQKTWTWIMHFKFVAGDAFTTCVIRPRNLFPIHLGQQSCDELSFNAGLQTNQSGDGLVEINDVTLFVHDQHAVFNRVEQRFKKTALPRQPLDDSLQTFRVQPPDAAKHLVEKTGFGRWH